MNYIYDITLNFNRNNIYEFYEWREEDDPEFILKIPLYKVDKESFFDFKMNDVIVTKNFLEQIEDKTEVYTPNTISVIRYASIFLYENSCIAIEFDSDGNTYMKSNISIDEELEIVESSENIKYSIIEYKLKNKSKVNKKYITRKENEMSDYLLNKLENIVKNNEISKLKYIFYELYNEKLDDVDKIYSKLFNVIKNSDNKFYKLQEIFLLIDNKKIMSNNS